MDPSVNNTRGRRKKPGTGHSERFTVPVKEEESQERSLREVYSARERRKKPGTVTQKGITIEKTANYAVFYYVTGRLGRRSWIYKIISPNFVANGKTSNEVTTLNITLICAN